MKIFICIMAIVALAAAKETAQTYSVSSSFVSLLEGIRDDMPCGFPLLGIGPLAPLSISYKSLDVNIPTLKILGSVKNFTLNDLNKYDVLDTKHNAIKRKFTFSILFENIEVDTWYDLETYFQESGWTVKVVGSGDANFALKGLLLSVTAKYSINFLDARLKLKSLKIVPHIESVVSNIEGILGNGPINKKWNAELEKTVPAFVNVFGEAIADKIEAIILPKINLFLYQYNLNDILSGIGGNSVEGEKIKCVPAEEKAVRSF